MHSQARSYLFELLQGGLLTLDAGESTTYTTTPEGLEHMKHQRVLVELISLA